MKTIAVLTLLLSPMAFALDCNNPPTNGWGTGYTAYANWCTSCGGTPYNSNGVGCKQGPNRGSSASSSAPGNSASGLDPNAAAAAGMMQLGTQMMVEGFKGLGQETPEQRAAREMKEKETSERRQRKQEQLNSEMSASIALLTNDDSSTAAESQPSRVCKDAESTEYICHVPVCGGAYNGSSVCCPDGFPKLNECDCKCYRANADIECKRHAACQYSTPKPAVEKK